MRFSQRRVQRLHRLLSCLVLYILAVDTIKAWAASTGLNSLGFAVHRQFHGHQIRRSSMHTSPAIVHKRLHSSKVPLQLSRLRIDSVDEPSLLETVDASDVDTTSDQITNERTLGILVLLTVPLAWGTYTPVVKYMYDRMDPSVPGFVFSAGYYVVAAVVLGALNWRNTPDEVSNDNLDIAADASTLGGLELGSYLFLGNGFQVVGLQTVPADRAAFLVQLTTVMVPLVSAWVSGRGLASVPLMTWLACTIAFIGVIVMGMDDNGQSTEVLAAQHLDLDSIISSIQITQGDGLIILAALAYTMHVVRLGVYAPRTRPLTLAASKARTEAILSLVLVMALALVAKSAVPEFVQQLGKEILNYFETVQSMFLNNDNTMEAASHATDSSSVLIFVAAILWTGLITSAYTIYVQSFGQRRINPVDSNLIYTTQPLFSSLFAYGLLGERLGVSGWTGATLIGAALGLVAFGKDDKTKE